jgi:stage V sporulation protein G
MEISDVRVKLIEDAADRLRAVCTVTLDNEFVIRDVKVVSGSNGLFVAMPSRKMSTHCPKCGFKNAVRSKYCNECGGKLPPSDVSEEDNGRTRLHRDIAHPITSSFRERLQTRVLRAYEDEAEASHDPNYKPRAVEVESSEEEAEESSLMTEYDSIIADLRSSGPKPSGRDRGPAPRERNGGSGQRAEGERGRGSRGGEKRGRSDERTGGRREEGRGGRREESRGERGRSDQRRREGQRPPQAAESEPRELDRRSVEPSASEPARPPRQAEKPVERVTAPPQVTPKPPVQHDNDDDMGFGEGIL